ncbi:MAG: hypothetical protein WC637_16290 [Victivallales bacterium]|jgi:hypothetical protein
MKIENDDPINLVLHLREWFKEHIPSTDTSILAEAKKRCRTVTEIIDRLDKLNIPIPEDVSLEKVNLEKMLNSSSENKVQLKELAEALSLLLEDIKSHLRYLRKSENDSGDQKIIHQKGLRKKLQVTLPDGKIIKENKAVETFVKVIQLLGVKRIAAIQSIKCLNYPLVSIVKNENARNLYEIEGYYIETNSSTAAKARFIELIAKELNLDMSVKLLD